MKKLLFILLALPMFATAQEKRVRVEASCHEGSAFTISIPFKLPPEADTVWYRWYFKGKLVEDTARVATRDNLKIAYTIPADSTYGADVEAYFDYQLSDECCDVWTRSPVYVVTFLSCPPPQVSAISGSTAVCARTTGLTYSVTNVSGVTYTWTLPAGWIKTAGGNTNSITVTAGVAGVDAASGNISVTPYSECGGYGETQTLAVTVNPLPAEPSAITGSSVFCTGVSLTYSVTNRAGTTYSWEFPPGWSIAAGQNTNNVTVYASSTSGTIVVTPTTTATGCAGVYPSTRAVTQSQGHTLTLTSSSPNMTVCTNDFIPSISYVLGGGATGASISWSPPAHIVFSTTMHEGEALIYGELDADATPGAYPYTITTTGGYCATATASGTITVNAYSRPLMRSGGAASQTVCTGTAITSIVYTGGGSTTGSSISWSPSAPAGISYSTSGAKGTISGTPTTAGVYTYTITTSGHTAPCTAVTATGTITVNASHTITLLPSSGSTSQSACEGQYITPIVFAVGGGATSGYVSWSPRQPGFIGWFVNDQTYGSTIRGQVDDLGSFNYTITTTGNSCPAATITGNLYFTGPVPPQPSAISGNTSVCPNTTQTYYVNALAGNVNYYWRLPSGWTGNNSTLNSITVNAGTSGGTISVEAFNITTNCYSPARTLDVSIKTSGCP